MSRTQLTKAFGLAVAIVGFFVAEASANYYYNYYQVGQGRYRYGNETHHYVGPYHASNNYTKYYYSYYGNNGWQNHTVYYCRPQRYYYYRNGVTGKYWGRCMAGSSNYEKLAEPTTDLASLNGSEFKPQGRMTNVPGMPPGNPIVPPPPEPPTE